MIHFAVHTCLSTCGLTYFWDEVVVVSACVRVFSQIFASVRQ